MGKYQNLEKDIFSVFSSSAWKAEKITTTPNNVQLSNNGDEFIRVSIIPNGVGLYLNSISGVVIIDIFISAGKGPNRALLIADKLDQYLVGESLSTQDRAVTQFYKSSVQPIGIDAANATLYRSSYTIPFSYFGV